MTVLLSCLLLASGCGSSASPDPGGSSAPVTSMGPSATVGRAGPAGPVKVVLGLYSGRPDPEWTLATEQARSLDALLATLPEGNGTPPVGGLGYHGFTILRPGATLLAYRGAVAPPGDGPRIVKADPTRSVERYLLETGRPHLDAVEHAEVERALAGP